MKVLMLMFDSLNRHMLPNYGCDWTQAPNFQRLAKRTVTFDRSYVCSMPCMPARRDLHTGRPNFLHRSWGPLEPFDDSLPKLLGGKGIYSHLASDHYHYWEAGGATYHTQYNTWEFFRGQEGDPWRPLVAEPDYPGPERAASRNAGKGGMVRQDVINRQVLREESAMPQACTMRAGLDFLERNATSDNWFLQIETFDPHEPFFSQRRHKDRYAQHYANYEGKQFDWPFYDFVKEGPDEVEHVRHEYASLLSMCDAYLGDVLDAMDRLKLWDDTMLIVWTDHGFLLGEHNCWAKMWMPFYEEVAHTPFFVWDPRCGKQGERRGALVQPAIDLAPTILDFFGQPCTADMRGKNLRQTIERDASVREAGMFGIFGGQVNVTDGRYVYMRSETNPDAPLCEYTHMPTHMRELFSVEEMRSLELAEPFSFTKNCRTMKLRSRPFWGRHPDLKRSLLYDLEADPQQQRPLDDAKVEKRMVEHLVGLMRECDAPAEQYQRLGLAK